MLLLYILEGTGSPSSKYKPAKFKTVQIFSLGKISDAIPIYLTFLLNIISLSCLLKLPSHIIKFRTTNSGTTLPLSIISYMLSSTSTPCLDILQDILLNKLYSLVVVLLQELSVMCFVSGFSDTFKLSNNSSADLHKPFFNLSFFKGDKLDKKLKASIKLFLPSSK